MTSDRSISSRIRSLQPRSHIPTKRRQNLILIGFMGSGKTTVGRRVAASLGFEFVDTDDRVVEMAGKPITQIFADQGEAHFRKLESAALKEVLQREHCVVATGGGIVTIPENVALLQEGGYTVWLHAPVDEIFERVSRNRERPLLQTEDPLATIQTLLSKREPLYRSTADFEVDTGPLTLDETVYGLTETALIFFSSDATPPRE